MATTADSMALEAKEVLGISPNRAFSESTADETWRGFFGAPMVVIVDVWNRLQPLIQDSGAKKKHLLWALVFLKIYSTTAVHCRIVGWPDPKTYRKWTWFFLEKIALLKDDLIVFDDRLNGWNGRATALMTVDCIDCMINEPWPFNRGYYSHKFNGPGLKYEVGVTIQTGRICWINGPHKAGKKDDTIFNETLSGALFDDEVVEVDGGYKGNRKFKSPEVASSRQERKQKSIVRGRHECVNGRLKIFNVLQVPFRHLTPRDKVMEKHGTCFVAIAVITQLKFMHGEDLFMVEYDVTYD